MKTEEHGDDFDDMNDSFDYDDFDKNIQDYITATPELIDLNEYQRKHELNVMNLKSRMLKKLHKTEKLNYTQDGRLTYESCLIYRGLIQTLTNRQLDPILRELRHYLRQAF